MLQLYDKNKNKLKGLTKYKDYCIESVLKTGDKTLSFLYPSKFIDGIVEEGYIRNKTDEFVVKEIGDSGEWTSIKAQMNVEDLEGKAWEHFNTIEQTIENCLNLACASTGWTVQVNNVTKKRTVKKTNCSSWEIIQEVKKIYRVEIEFDTLNKVVKAYEKLGQDKGVYFSDQVNLKALDIESNSYDFYTKIIAIGKENIKVEVENFQYSNKVKTLIWKDERYTVLENLREDATAKLQELSKPRKSYSADVIDLAKLNSKYKNILDYKLGDTITLISKDKKIREKQRIVKITEYPDEPERNSCEIANTTLDFIDIQKEFQDTADTVNNITEDNGTISEEAIKVAVKNLTIDKADINSLNAAVARIGTLEATKANITELNAVNAKITNLQANKAEITDLIAGNIKFDVATGGTLDLQTLLSKFVTGENGQFLNLTTDNVTISNALIKDIIAKNISVGDLKAGNIDSNRFNIVGTDGNLLIKDNTIQIKDSARVRVQIGKDASGDYSMYVWDKQGNLMFDALGLKSSAIKDKIIRDDMVADTANINGSKLNISSLITEVNKDNTQTLKASRISFDSTGQSLEVSFNSLKSNVDNMEIGGRNLQGNADFNKPLSGTWRYAPQFMSINEDMLCGGYKSVKILRTNATTTGSTIYLYSGADKIPAKHGEEFTMSFMYYIPEDVTQEIDGSFYAGVYFYKDKGAGAGSKRIDLAKEIVKGKWTKVIVTGKATDIDTKSVAFVVGCNKNCEVYISKPKLERGNKATDFTVAPEDIEEKIESNTTSVTVAQGKIEGLIKESSITKGDVTTLKDNYTSIKATVDGINTTVASHTSSIGNLTADLSGVSGKVATVENKQASLEQNLNGFNITVSNLKKIVQEGNNNLVSNSNWFKGPSGWRLSTTLEGNYFYGVSASMVLEDKHYIRLGHSKNNKTNTIYADSSKFPVSPGEKITYGAFGAATSNARLRIYLLFTSNIDDINTDNSFMTGYTSILYEGNASYTKKNLTVIVPDGAVRAFIRVRIDKIDTSINTNSSGVFSSLMVRKGEEVFEWCPSQGDSYNYIDEQTAKLQVNINDITSRVSSTESTISTINGNVSSLQTRMSSAEQKITNSSIIQTVQSTINNAKTEAINIANSTTDTKLHNYATKASMELTANQLKLDFSSSGGYNLIKDSNLINNDKFYWWHPYVGSFYWQRNSGQVGIYTRVNEATAIYQTVQVKPYTTYTLSAVLTPEVSTSGAVLIIELPQENGRGITSNIVEAGSSRRESITITTQNSTEMKIAVRHLGSKNNTGGYVCWIKDLLLTEGKLLLPWTPNPNEVYSGNTIIDGSGVKIRNGALTVLNNSGQVMLQGDSAGNLIFEGRLQPCDHIIKLFGEECRIDADQNILRIQKNRETYISIDNSELAFYTTGNNKMAMSFEPGSNTALRMWGNRSGGMLKFRRDIYAVESRNSSDNGYGIFIASAFNNASSRAFKTDITEPTDIDFIDILKNNHIKKYKLKADIERLKSFPTAIDKDGKGMEIYVDEKLGFILEELTEEAKLLLNPRGTPGIDSYSMCSMLWGIVQEQQKRIEALENLQ
ncbi:phage tail protein [Clostridium sp. DSM 100503]|uniref:phage tail protein n=1 Tax=Clostridium sp. DSM 100503 TaxID=2963282 RepID=UPI00214A683A|nr:phage tail spike protein [Clostridium sp. DSM 100503]MCR1952889.1 phage tail protein [Clostridium sp. DSM 100503]